MLKFFRKIRQQLMTENKFSKYLLYAGGEILLVVIGILLAIQINLLNQARIDKITEKEYYQRFLDDVLLDEELISIQTRETIERLKGSNRLIEELQKGYDNMEIIASAIIKSVSKSNFGLRPTQTTYEDIISSGNIKLIRDMELRKRLDDYYTFMNGLMNTINSNASRPADRMLNKEDIIGTGMYHMTKQQNGLDSSIVNIEDLERLSKLTPENRLVLMNDAIFYSGITSRNLQHFETLKGKVNEMKELLHDKCN